MTFECYKCASCSKLLVVASDDYITVQKLKVTSHEKSKGWDPESCYTKVFVEQADDASTVFCNVHCFSAYLIKKKED